MEGSLLKSISSSTITAALLILGLAAPAYALSNRAWVSGHGTDAPGCAAPTNPCRTFQYVHDNIIAPGGEIDVLDPAGYGTITITKALSIINDGAGTAGLQPPAGNFVPGVITINAGGNDAVTLRGLTIDGFGFSSGSAVLLNSGGRLTIDNCVVFNFNNAGINVAPRLATPVNVFVAISNTIVAESVGNPAYGILLGPTLMANVTAEINHTTAVGIGAAGVFLGSFDSAPVVSATIIDSVSTMNGFGIQVGHANHVVRIGHSVLTANRIGVVNDGTALSYGDNEIDSNGTNVQGTLTLIPMH
jgi:hypothetical protein